MHSQVRLVLGAPALAASSCRDASKEDRARSESEPTQQGAPEGQKGRRRHRRPRTSTSRTTRRARASPPAARRCRWCSQPSPSLVRAADGRRGRTSGLGPRRALANGRSPISCPAGRLLSQMGPRAHRFQGGGRASTYSHHMLAYGCQAVRCCQVICRAVGQLSGTIRCLCQTSCHRGCFWRS